MLCMTSRVLDDCVQVCALVSSGSVGGNDILALQCINKISNKAINRAINIVDDCDPIFVDLAQAVSPWHRGLPSTRLACHNAHWSTQLQCHSQHISQIGDFK